MDISRIMAFPTTIKAVPHDSSGVHESILRSYHILGKVKDLLIRGTPADVVLELMAEMESGPGSSWPTEYESDP